MASALPVRIASDDGGENMPPECLGTSKKSKDKATINIQDKLKIVEIIKSGAQNIDTLSYVYTRTGQSGGPGRPTRG